MSATYNQVAHEDLHDLGLQAGAALEGLLQDPDEEVAQRCAHKGAVGSHLGHTRGEVVSMLVAVLSQPRSKKLLATGKCARSEHLCAQRVLLQLLDVGSKVALGAGILAAAGQRSADNLSDGVVAAGAGNRGTGKSALGGANGVQQLLGGRRMRRLELGTSLLKLRRALLELRGALLEGGSALLLECVPLDLERHGGRRVFKSASGGGRSLDLVRRTFVS